MSDASRLACLTARVVSITASSPPGVNVSDRAWFKALQDGKTEPYARQLALAEET